MLKFKPLKNWKDILKLSWSIRFIIIAGILQAIEVVLPFFMHSFNSGTFTVLTFVATVAAFISRIVAQNGLSLKDEDEESKE